MLKRRVNKLGWLAGAGLVTLALAAAPARAHHDVDIVLPVVTAFAIGALWNHGHGEHYYRHGYRYQRHGYQRHGYYRHGHHRKHGKYRHGRSHYGHEPRHSSSHGGYHRPSRKH